MARLADASRCGWYASPAAAPVVDPIFGRPHRLLSLHAAGVAAAGRLADDAGDPRLRSWRCSSRSIRAAARVAAGRAADARRRLARPRVALGACCCSRLRCRSISAASIGCSTITPSSPASPTPTRTSRSPACCSSRSRSSLGAVDRARQRRRRRRVSAGSSPRSLPGRRLPTSSSASSARTSSSFIVKPNELVREQPYIAHNIEFTRQAYGLDRDRAAARFRPRRRSRRPTPANNQATLQNIRLWDWRALQDTLRQIQEIRTYYDFPDIDIDRYVIDGTLRQVMLADARAERRRSCPRAAATGSTRS